MDISTLPRVLTQRNGESWPRIAREAWRGYRHPLPTLRTSDLQHHPPTVYFCTPDYNVPAGGIRVVYRHVDHLNEAGIRASVLHARTNFRCTWFENDTQVVGGNDAVIGPDDLVVVGELAASIVGSLPPGYRFALFNQGPHLTWRMDDELLERCALSPDLAAMLTVSDHGVELLRHAFPKADVRRLHNSIDPSIFFCGEASRPRRIAYMPRRGRDEARQVLGVLHGRGTLRGWDVTAIENLKEREVGDRLRSSMIFLSFAYQEGFGLPAAEAMAAGAYVVGFHGFGGIEFFRPEFSSPVETGDVISFARTLEQVLEREQLQPGWCASRGSAAAEFIKAEYSPERERRDVVAIYASLMAPASARGRSS
jgi:glycosyltransferase involved in cell wall biosynthesis